MEYERFVVAESPPPSGGGLDCFCGLAVVAERNEIKTMSTIHVFHGTHVGCELITSRRIGRDPIGEPREGDLVAFMNQGFMHLEKVLGVTNDGCCLRFIHTECGEYAYVEFGDIDETHTSVCVDYLTAV